MNITNDIKPVTYLKSKAALLLNQINETRRPVIITQNGEAKVVVQDIREFEKNEETKSLIRFFNSREQEFRKGNYEPWDVALKDLEERIENYGK